MAGQAAANTLVVRIEEDPANRNSAGQVRPPASAGGDPDLTAPLTPAPAQGAAIPRYTSNMLQPTGQGGAPQGAAIPRYTSSMLQPMAAPEVPKAQFAIDGGSLKPFADAMKKLQAETGKDFDDRLNESDWTLTQRKLAELQPLANQAGLGGIAGKLGGVAGQAAAAGLPGGEAAVNALGGLAKVAGPVGLGLTAVKAGTDLMVGAFQAAGEAAKFAGQQLRAVASNDVLALANNTSEAVLKTVEKVPLIFDAQVAGIRAANAVVNEFADTVQAFVARGKELAKFSPQLAVAGATADIRAMQSDMQEARRLGDSLATLTDESSQFYALVRELLLPIKDALTDSLAVAMKLLTEFLREARPFLAVVTTYMGSQLELWTKFLSGDLTAIPELIRSLPERFVAALRGDKGKTTAGFSDLFPQYEGMEWSSPEGAKARDQALNVPLFQGM